ncbi:MAG: topoisomerase DNA-binding C4 zinc finger domain-containing protein [Candidatus Acidiferrales bacterium]
MDAWKTSICTECRTANAAQQKAQREEQERAWKADAEARKTRLRARYADRALGDCPRCEGILIVRKSSTGGTFVGCALYPACTYTQPIPKKDKLTAEEIAEARKLLADAPKCGKCGAAMRRIEGKYGPFLGCSQYPRCRETVSLTAEPTQPESPAPVGNDVLPTEPQPPMTFEEQERAKMQAELAKPWSE